MKLAIGYVVGPGEFNNETLDGQTSNLMVYTTVTALSKGARSRCRKTHSRMDMYKVLPDVVIGTITS